MQSSMKRQFGVFLVGIVVLTTPSVACANAGTPLMLAGFFHLWIGNALIGILEGAIIALVFRVSYVRAVSLMVLANYFSAWLGWFWISSQSVQEYEVDLYGANRFIWKMLAATYVATIVLEWPFVAGCLWKTSHWFRRSWMASLLIQSASYVLLMVWYQQFSVNSLLTQTLIVKPDQIALPSDIRIYFISEKDGNVYTRRLSGGTSEKIFDLLSRDSQDILSLEASKRDSEAGQLIVLRRRFDGIDPVAIRLGIEFPATDCPTETQSPPTTVRHFPTPGGLVAARLGSASESPWSCEGGWYPAEGLSGKNSQTGAHFRIGLEVAFIHFVPQNPILLPGDIVLFELWPGQICIYELNTKKLAVIERGHGAIAVMDPPSQTSE